MTTGTSPEPVPLARRWAAEQLGVEQQADPEAARAALLRKLQGVEFVPPPGWRRALRVLTAPAGAAAPACDAEGLRTEYDRLRPEVESFAATFWTFPPAERRRRLEELSLRCAYLPTLRARLNALGPGMSLDPVAPEKMEPETATLASEVLALFVLRPAEQAVRRRQLLRRVRERPLAWERAARNLRHGWPTIAALQPALLDRLADGANARDRYDRLRRAAASRATPTAGKAGSRGLFRGGWLVIVLLVTVFRLIGSINSPPPSPPPPVVPREPPLDPWKNGIPEVDPALKNWTQDPEFQRRQRQLDEEAERVRRQISTARGTPR